MPSLFWIDGFRFFFYSNEGNEPPHIHIQNDNKLAKFWLKPVRLAKSTRFTPKELRKLEKLVEENSLKIMEAWNEYFYQK